MGSRRTTNTYKVWWHTQIAIGSTFYEGREIVQAEDEAEAADRAQFGIWRRAFQDYSLSHIVITRVEQER